MAALAAQRETAPIRRGVVGEDAINRSDFVARLQARLSEFAPDGILCATKVILDAIGGHAAAGGEVVIMDPRTGRPLRIRGAGYFMRFKCHGTLFEALKALIGGNRRTCALTVLVPAWRRSGSGSQRLA